MSTHFLIEGADKGSYRGLCSIKGELRSFLLHYCCLLLLTASVWRRWEPQDKGPRVLLGPSQRMLGRQSLHELLFEALLQNSCSEFLSSLLSFMLMCLKGKWIFILILFSPSVLCSSFFGCDVRSVPKVGPSLQKPFSQYLEAQRNKLHHAGGSAPAVRIILLCNTLRCHPHYAF